MRRRPVVQAPSRKIGTAERPRHQWQSRRKPRETTLHVWPHRSLHRANDHAVPASHSRHRVPRELLPCTIRNHTPAATCRSSSRSSRARPRLYQQHQQARRAMRLPTSKTEANLPSRYYRATLESARHVYTARLPSLFAETRHSSRAAHLFVLCTFSSSCSDFRVRFCSLSLPFCLLSL